MIWEYAVLALSAVSLVRQLRSLRMARRSMTPLAVHIANASPRSALDE